MLNRNLDLIAKRGLPNTINCSGTQINIDNTSFLNQIVLGMIGATSQLPIDPGFEIHPYKGMLKFTKPSKMLIGTFPPISYLIDTINNLYPGLGLDQLTQPTPPHQHISKPTIPFFHGNVASLWSVFLTQGELNTLNAFLPLNRIGAKNYLISLLNNLNIYYDDIIISTQRELGEVDKRNIRNLGYTYEDVNLKNICTDKILIINTIKNRNLKVVCFTNGATFRTNGLQLYTQKNKLGLVKTSTSDALSFFLRGCQELGLVIEMQCLPNFAWAPLNALTQAQLSKKLIFEIRIKKGDACKYPDLNDFKENSFIAITPFSPAAHGTIEQHPIVRRYRAINGITPLSNILKDIYDKFRNNLHQLLYAYNI